MKNWALLFLLFTTHLLAEEPSVYLTWKKDPTSTMTVMWITKNNDTNDAISYQKTGNKNWQHAKGSHHKLPNKEPYFLHKVELSRLEADTIYRFTIGDRSKTYAFHTMPKKLSKAIRFVTGGDAFHNNFKRFETMCKQAAKQNPRFAILGGDLSYAAPKKGGKENWKQWQKFFSCWSQVMKDKDGCLIPLLVTIGNHEVTGSFNRSMRDAPFYYMFFEKATYDISFGNWCHLTFLDSNHTQKIKGEQTKWLEKVLRKNKNHLHRFAIYHVGAYPSSNRFTSTTSQSVRKHWVPLFEKYKIHACFESHDHAYKRTYPLIRDKQHSRGIVYFGDGSWGVKPRKPSKRPYLAKTAQKQQALVVELTPQKRSFWAVDKDGKIIDRYEQSAG